MLNRQKAELNALMEAHKKQTLEYMGNLSGDNGNKNLFDRTKQKFIFFIKKKIFPPFICLVATQFYVDVKLLEIN